MEREKEKEIEIKIDKDRDREVEDQGMPVTAITKIRRWLGCTDRLEGCLSL